MVVSIIVPIYNTEKYLNRCVDSLLHQTYNNIEVLLVDDGSTDKSATICDEYSVFNNRIKVVHKPNGGEASARNMGLMQATGEYIMFVDSDDEYMPDAVETLIKSVDGSDLAVAGYLEKSGDITRAVIMSRETYNVQELMFETLSNDFGTDGTRYLASTVNAKLFKHNLLKQHNIKFNETFVVGNDTLFVYDYLNHCATIRNVWKPIYIYYKFHISERVQGMAWEYPNIYRLEIPALERRLQLAQINGAKRKNYAEAIFNSVIAYLVKSAIYEEKLPNGLLSEVLYVLSEPIVQEGASVYRRIRIKDSKLIPFCLKHRFVMPLCYLLRARAKKLLSQKYVKKENVRSIVKNEAK